MPDTKYYEHTEGRDGQRLFEVICLRSVHTRRRARWIKDTCRRAFPSRKVRQRARRITYTNSRVVYCVDKTKNLGVVLMLDTNIIIKVCDNNSFAEHVRWCVRTGSHEIVISSSVIKELERHGLSMQFMPAILRTRLGIESITYGTVSKDERKMSRLLEDRHSTLHRGDSEILAFAHARGFVLVTCDNGLTAAARDVGVKCINPCTKGRRDMLRRTGR